ncbi:enoyl-CoA hydratase/isomerase family protein [Acidovorax sp. MR-S7]|uniref:enoyl-CoA hydratase/isomerase family protein n=1 Tax=Acidovorax sp. MR-S7 TaxID=1268622 RepID=UPI00039DCCC9|nr:enoyl-CoA hydratase-related protein [Acidovorax sp. MR-S7]GAD24567.1 enoyl-CoA hydratase/carnithine racemase [Acidovorax sp. MR-S7]
MERITVRDYDDGVTLFTINRPERRNAICSRTAIELQNAFAAFDKSSQKVAVITGAGNEAFSAGADVNDVPELWRCIPTAGVGTEKPIVAAVAGWCVGGGILLPMMSDLVVAAENTKFSYPEAKLGLTQGMIAAMAARIPHKVAMEVMILARILDAKRAKEVGFINDVVPVGEQVDAALAMARELAGMAPLVIKTIKRFVTNSILPIGPSEHMARARRDLEIVSTSHDYQEGFASYKEKRTPVFQGR